MTQRPRPGSPRPGSPAARPPLRVREPDAVPAVVPHLLGFVPDTSLVVLGLGDGADVAATLRWDLPPDDAHLVDEAVGCYAQSVPALLQAGARRAILAVYPGLPGTRWDEVVVDDLPHRGVVLGFAEALADVGVGMSDLVCVVGDRYRSYLCSDAGCCPPEGRRVVPDAAAVAELVAMGSAPFPSRQALVESLDPRPDGDRVVVEARRVRDGVLLRAPHDLEKRVLAFVDGCRRFGRRPGASPAPARMVALAGLIVGDVTTRDLLLMEMAQRLTYADLQAVRLVLTEAVRCARGPRVAPPAACLALAAYFCGDGATARVAVDRALEADAAYSLALLAEEGLDRGLPPSEWRAGLRGLTAQRILDAARPDPRSRPA